jgi:hypothetical protein
LRERERERERERKREIERERERERERLLDALSVEAGGAWDRGGEKRLPRTGWLRRKKERFSSRTHVCTTCLMLFIAPKYM